jgi:hypothetical protein
MDPLPSSTLASLTPHLLYTISVTQKTVQDEMFVLEPTALSFSTSWKRRIVLLDVNALKAGAVGAGLANRVGSAETTSVLRYYKPNPRIEAKIANINAKVGGLLSATS